MIKQLIEGLRYQDLFLYQMLDNGELPNTNETRNEGDHHWDEEGLSISKDVLFNIYMSWAKATPHQMEAGGTKAVFTKKITEKIIPSSYGRRVGARTGREPCIILPSLKKCWKEFAKYIGGHIEWTDDDDDDNYEEDDLG